MASQCASVSVSVQGPRPRPCATQGRERQRDVVGEAEEVIDGDEDEGEGVGGAEDGPDGAGIHGVGFRWLGDEDGDGDDIEVAAMGGDCVGARQGVADEHRRCQSAS